MEGEGNGIADSDSLCSCVETDSRTCCRDSLTLTAGEERYGRQKLGWKKVLDVFGRLIFELTGWLSDSQCN